MACLNEAMGKGRKTLVLVIAKLRKKYTLKALLNYTKLAKSTYYDALKKLSREDKYKGLKTLIRMKIGYRKQTFLARDKKSIIKYEENLTCQKYKNGQEGKIAKKNI